ncbi:MAG: sel1 repeat family protein [Rhodocyclaceae bacterium]|nr:sel1 repeat family protein [Rhodocyclaceae bacterium]
MSMPIFNISRNLFWLLIAFGFSMSGYARDPDLTISSSSRLVNSSSVTNTEITKAIDLVKKGGKSNIDNALEILHRAAKKGNPDAQFYLGSMFLDGLGVEASSEKARQWFLRAAENGNTNAQYNIASMMESGAGGLKDVARAIVWLRKASAGGHGVASSNLGAIYLEGRGVPIDKKLAVDFFAISAKQKYVPAMRSLGRLYLTGEGVPEKPSQRHRATWRSFPIRRQRKYLRLS